MKDTMYKTTLEAMCAIALIFGVVIAVTAMAAYNHGNTAYAIYATGQAAFCGMIAMTFAIIRAT